MDATQNLSTELDKTLVSIEIAFKSLFKGRKWMIYVFLYLLPLILFFLFVEDKLMGAADAPTAFMNNYFLLFWVFFTFGCLIFALPMSSDEISDHIMDFYLVRPVRREVLWFSRWFALNVSIIAVNFVLALIYYLYFHFFDTPDFLTSVVDNTYLLFDVFLYTCAASLIYGGIFLLVGFIGNRGFSLGVLLAIFEMFFLSIFFLADEPYIPRTNLSVIGDELFDPQTVSSSDFLWSLGYVAFVAIGTFIVGAYFVRRREFP